MENRLKKQLALIKARARQMPGASRRRREHDDGADEPPCTLAEAAPGEAILAGGEPLYRIRLEGVSIAGDAPAVAAAFRRIPNRRTWPLISLVRDPGPDMARRIRANEVCFFDIETTGLAPNTYVFLCGVMVVEGDHFVVEQLLARDYGEEAGILRYLRGVMTRYPMFVTYNGEHFDMPFVRTRMAVARVEEPPRLQHVDLIRAARRNFAGTLPDCRLETVERHLRGTSRQGDIPGAEIPGAYHEFVRTGDARRIKRILYHNRMDLLAMVYIINHLADDAAPDRDSTPV